MELTGPDGVALRKGIRMADRCADWGRVIIAVAVAGILAGCQQTAMVQAPAPIEQISEQKLIAEQIEEQKAQAISLYVDATMLNDLNERLEAIRKLELALELDPEFAVAYSLKGDIHQAMEEYPQSAAAYEKATEFDPWSFKDFFNLGKVCQAMKEFVRAAAAYVTACKLDPNHYQAHFNAARCYYELKEFDSSLEYAGLAKKLEPDKSEVEALMGDLHEAKKDHTEAISAYKRALEMEGNSVKIMVPLSAAYLRSGRYSAAKELLVDVVNTDPNNAIAHQYLGFAKLKLKETNEAVESYKRAVAIDDGDWMAHKGLGVAYMLLAMQNNNDQKLEAMAMEQWGISLQLKSDQPELKTLMNKYK